MARTYYYVVNSGNQWEIKFDGQENGTRYVYATQADAINAAAAAANTNFTQNGRPSGVRIQGQNGQWRDERTYGNDPHPPRG